jgi:2-dehydropantoate 2-reductase
MSAPRICVAGAGAVGSSLAAHLAMGGQSVSLLARGARREALLRDGLRYVAQGQSEVRLDVPVGDARELGVQDIVFTAVKAQSLPGLVPHLKRVSDGRTTVVPLVNGIPWWFFLGAGAPLRVSAVDPLGTLAEAFPAANIIGAVVYLTATMEQDGVVRSHAHRKLEIGDIDGDQRERTRDLAAMLTGIGIETAAVPNIRERLWTKVALNLATNPLSVVTGVTLSEMFTDPLLQPLILAVAGEVRAIAAAYGSRLSMEDAQMVAVGQAAGPFKTSMLQDFEKGTPLELAAIADACIELGRQKGIEMPVSSAVASLAAFKVGRGPDDGEAA